MMDGLEQEMMISKDLGDWFANLNKLEHGISGLSKRIEEECGMKFGLWFEPEMVNENGELISKTSRLSNRNSRKKMLSWKK